MSVVYGSDDVEEANQQPQSFWAKHPFLTLALAAGAALVIIEVFRSKQQSANPPTTTTQTTPGTSTVDTTTGVPATDPNGNPVYYVPTSDVFLNYNYAANSFDTNSGNTSSATTTTSTVNNPAPPPAPPPPAPPVNTPPPVVSPPPKQTKGSWTCRYTVVHGDTLSGIASKYGTTWPVLYGHNTAEINLIAGVMHEVIPGGPWNNIMPGEVLTVPCQ